LIDPVGGTTPPHAHNLFIHILEAKFISNSS
jgi:hypothetical protein